MNIDSDNVIVKVDIIRVPNSIYESVNSYSINSELTSSRIKLIELSRTKLIG